MAVGSARPVRISVRRAVPLEQEAALVSGYRIISAGAPLDCGFGDLGLARRRDVLRSSREVEETQAR